MKIELSDNERKLLERVLRYYLSQLRGEIVKTEAYKWKKALHEEKNMLKDIVNRLS